MSNELPWHQISDAADFTLVVPRCVVKEIDRLKYDGNSRRAKKARIAASQFNNILKAHNRTLIISSEKPSVSVVLAPPLQINWDKHPQLDSSRNDDCLVAEAIAYSDLQQDVRIVSYDFGPIHTAEHHGVKYFQVSDDWLLPPEHDERDKRIQQLENELTAYKNKQPDIDIQFQAADGSTVSQYQLTVQQVDALSDTEIDALTDFICARHPMKPFLDKSEKMSPAMLLLALEPHPSPERIQKYKDEEYPKYLGQVRRYFRTISRRLVYESRLWPFSIYIENCGHIPALNVILDVEVHGGLLLLDKPINNEDVQLPEPPKPPSVYDALLHTPALLSPFSTTGLFQLPHIPPQHDSTAFYWKAKPSSFDNPAGKLTCDELRHQTSYPLSFFLMVPHKLNDARGAIYVKFSASNLPKPVRQTLPIKVTSQTVDICQLASEKGFPPEVCLALEKVRPRRQV